jgi:hypothetical protein
MEERKQKKEASPDLDSSEPESFSLADPESIEIASGYSISVKYDQEGRPLIYVKKYGDVDTRGLRREIERSYPGAFIQGLEQLSSIEVKEEKDQNCRRQCARKREK